MNSLEWIQLLVFTALLLATAKPLGIYLSRVLDARGRTLLDPVVKPIETLTYRLTGVDPNKEQDWKGYATAMIVFSVVSMMFTYVLLRLQDVLPLNPQKLPALSEHLPFNTAASFTTNTNWQSYAGESTMSYFSQMVALTLHNFVSAAVGIGVAAALVRGMVRRSAQTIGNFWVDVTRLIYYVFLPICTVLAVFLISQGMIQNFKPYETAALLEPFQTEVPKLNEAGQPVTDAAGTPVVEEVAVDSQTMVQGPMASQVAIKMLGTNGGGYTNANAAHPYENPNPLSNFVQMFAIFVIPSALTVYLGREVKNLGHGWAVWAAMFVLFFAGVLVANHFEAAGNPNLTDLGVDPADGNLEGKEVRFGVFTSAMFATITTDASCGAVNAMHDSFTPMGGLVPLLNMQLGEVVFGGVGAGLYGMLVYVVIAVFIAGLMVGRTPEYLGKKIEPFDIKMASFVILITAFSILGFTAWACVQKFGLPDAAGAVTDGTNNSGPHGFSEILYAYTSATANNGSAFAGLTANSPWYNSTLGFAMLFGRFAMIIPILALAGSLARKKHVASSAGTFPVSGPLFTTLLVGTIVLIGALTFVPALVLGPVVEHFLMWSGRLF